MRTKAGQAAIEFAIAAFVLVLVMTSIIGFSRVFLKNIEMISEARTDAGIAALSSDEGSLASGGTAVGITQYAQPTIHTTAGERAVDPWQDAQSYLPAENRFADWASQAVTPITLVQGSAKKAFTFTLTLGGEPIFSEEGQISEEVWLPALNGVRTRGVGGDR